MGDGTFPIKITGDASSLVGATQQTNQALESTKIKLSELTPEQKANLTATKGVGEAAKQAGKDIDAHFTPAVGNAGMKLTGTKSILHGVREMFPTLVPFAYAAFHPIMLLGLALGGAFQLMALRIREAARAITEVVLPDISPVKVGAVTAMAEAWKGYSEALRAATTAYNGVEAASERAIKRMEGEAQQQDRLLAARKGLELANLEAKKGSMSLADYDKQRLEIEDRYERAGLKGQEDRTQKTIAMRKEEAARLRKDADEKIEQSRRIRVGTADQDTQMEGDLKARADEAQKDITDRKRRIGDYHALQAGEGNVFQRAGWRWNLNMALGQRLGTTPTDADYAKAVGQEQGVIGSEQGNVDRYNAWLREKPARDEARRLKNTLAGEAGTERGRAGIIESEAGEAGTAAAGVARMDRGVADIDAAGRVRQALAKANDDVKQMVDELIKSAEGGHGVTAIMMDKVKMLNARVAELEKMARAQDGRPPRNL